MKLLDRYIISELIGPFIFGIAAFSSILAGSTVLFGLVGFAFKYGAPWMEIVKIFFYKFPGIVAFTLPMSMLLSSILVVGRLNSDLEIVALRAGGIHIFRIIAPVIAAGLLVSFGTIWFNEFVVPRSNRSAEAIDDRIQEYGEPSLKKNINYTEFESNGLPKRLINAANINTDNELIEVTIAQFDNGLLSQVIRAQSGEWVPGVGWQFYNGVMHLFPKNDYDRVLALRFESELIKIPIPPQNLSLQTRDADQLNALELYTKIQQNAVTGISVAEDQVKFHLKFSVPFASFIFSILGSAVALRPARSTSSMGLGLSLLIIILYYILMSISMGIGLSGLLLPGIAAWIPNFIVGGLGLVFLRRRIF